MPTIYSLVNKTDKQDIKLMFSAITFTLKRKLVGLGGGNCKLAGTLFTLHNSAPLFFKNIFTYRIVYLYMLLCYYFIYKNSELEGKKIT